ncbi:hypothetical protein QR680_005029 [Steinernema hermaphroditum]|uniref:Uncharacterized protein n=1 Tax=Steinernema hermaphroditum TaxID=289476 RepID=A0AA39HQM0_9BILA|nr:hypothetical protein QR680_005029 [Steinernema hermaphroditum]
MLSSDIEIASVVDGRRFRALPLEKACPTLHLARSRWFSDLHRLEPHAPVEAERVEAMGTFTISYFAKKVFWEHKFLCLWVPAAYYFGTCWDRAGMHKASMMKGHSRMYADRIQAIPKNDDVWKY